MANNQSNNKYERNEKNENTTFVNPYNFVSIKHTACKREDIESKKDKELLTGYMECSLFVKTPLAIPGLPKNLGENKEKAMKAKGKKKKEEHKEYSFFSLDGNYPVIPGSSIRGALRSVYETVTGSCLSTMRPNTRLSRRIEADNPYKPGLLIKEENGWELYKASRYLIPIKNKYKKVKNLKYNSVSYILNNDNEERVIYDSDIREDFKYGDFVEYEKYNIKKLIIKSMTKKMQSDVEEKSGVKEQLGYVYVGEFINEKTGEGVFVKSDKTDQTIQSVQKALDDLEESLKVYRNESINKEYKDGEHTGYKGFERAKRQGVIPLWYKLENETLHLSMAAIGRTVYNKSLNDLVGDKSPCQQRSELCSACRLFGMIGENAVGSRIRITDAQLCKASLKAYDYADVTLKELATPRYSYYPFYAQNSKNFKNIKSYDADGTEIRGRKYYWHNPACEFDAAIYTDVDKNKRNATMQILKNKEGKKTKFQFRIYFDGIEKERLEELMWCVTLGENKADGVYCHKLGHGKPLGLGSVKMTITEVIKRTFGSEKKYQLETEDTGDIEIKNIVDIDTELPSEEKQKQERVVNELLTICNYEAMKDKQISYPYITMTEDAKNEKELREDLGAALQDNAMAAHQWFVRNKRREQKGLLPNIMDKDMLMPIYEVISWEEQDFEGIGEIFNVHGDNKYGFIKNDVVKRLFVHCSECKSFQLNQGCIGKRVKFNIGVRKKGYCAVNVKLEKE